MAEGYTRAKAGNIGVCIGTSGPAGTDMITGLYSASADSIPILCITGQAPVARLHKEDFQAINIADIAAPLTKMAMTVLEPAQVPGAFQQAFHLMRSGRPGPVLIDLPFDVQMAEIDFDPDTYEPLPVYKPRATRAQAVKALDMLQAAAAPLIVAGGGIINADASDLLVELAELLGVPVIPTLMGWGTIPDDHPLMAGMAGLQTAHQYGNATMLASDFVLGIGNRWANRHTGGLDTYREGRTFVHVDIEPTQIGRVFAPDYAIVSDAGAALGTAGRRWRASAGLPAGCATRRGCRPANRKSTMHRRTHFDDIPIKPQRVYEEMNKAFGPDTRYVSHDRAVADRRRPVPARLQAAALDQRRPGRTAGLDGAGHARGVRRRPGRHRGRADRRLRLPVHDGGTRGRCPVQPAVHPRAGEQRLPRPDPSVAARVRHGLLRPALLRQHQLRGRWAIYGVDHVKLAEAMGCKAIRVQDRRRSCPRWRRRRS